MKNPPKRKEPPKRAVTVSPYSDNRKTGPCSITYVTQLTCPDSCVLKDGGCYAEGGPIGIITMRLNEGAVALGWSLDQIAANEAVLIDRLPANNDLRIHGVGDCRTDVTAALVASACHRYMSRNPDVRAWSYTHAWMTVKRESWGMVSILASCETWEQVDEATSRGYACAIVVEDWETPDGRAWHLESEDGSYYTVIPCPYQTKEIQCVKCRLCMDDEKLRESRRVIAFKAQGARRKTVVATLRVLNNAEM